MNVDTGKLHKESGWINYKGLEYYLNNYGVVCTKELIKINDHELYLVDANGKKEIGIIKIGDNLYYFDTDTGKLKRNSC